MEFFHEGLCAGVCNHPHATKECVLKVVCNLPHCYVQPDGALLLHNLNITVGAGQCTPTERNHARVHLTCVRQAAQLGSALSTQ